MSLRFWIIPTLGFYDWKKLVPSASRLTQSCLRMAGSFHSRGCGERWKDKANGEIVQSCTIITTEPNELCATIHNRVPVILPPEAWGPWFDEVSTSDSELRAYKVDARIGNVKNRGAELMKPIA